MTACPWCGEPELLEIGEIWEHDFTIHTCCGARHEEIVTEMADDPQWATELLRHLGAEELTGFRLRRLYDDACSPPVLDFKLMVKPVTFAAMRAFVGEHHAHCAPPVCWRYGAAIYNGRTLIGVVSIGNPIAPALMSRGWVEVNRLCVRRDLAPQLAWNACSQLYGHAAREAARRGFRKIITYVRADEPGTSLVTLHLLVRTEDSDSDCDSRCNKSGRWSYAPPSPLCVRSSRGRVSDRTTAEGFRLEFCARLRACRREPDRLRGRQSSR